MTNSLIEEMLENLSVWDGTVTDGEGIITKNGVLVATIRDSDKQLTANDAENMQQVILKTEAIQQVIQAERKTVMSQLNQVTPVNRNKIVDSYISQYTDSYFVDRDY